MPEIVYIEGPKGEKGDRGERGHMGIVGKDGKDGRDGRDGEDGKDGKDGERGLMGLAGRDGRDGKDGKDGKDGEPGPKGDKGDPGKDGKDADMAQVADAIVQGVATHEGKYDHSKIDPYLIGSKTLSENGISDGLFLKYDAKQDKIVYAKVKETAQALSPYLRGGGTVLPNREGNAGKYLTTDGVNLSWATVSGGGLSDGNKGDVTVSGSGATWTINNDAVSNTKLANMATATIKGRATAGTGDPEDLTGTQATALLDVFTSAAKGLAPASGGGTTNYLRADGTWSNPSTGSGILRSVNVISINTNAGAAATTDYVYFVSGTTTLTLPTAVGNTNRYTVKNTGVNTVTISTTSSQTIDGSTSITLPVSNTSRDFVSDGSNWQVI